MADLEQAAGQALDAAQQLMSVADQARDEFAALRERLHEASERLEADWSRLTARAQTLLDQTEAEEKDLVAAQAAATEALDQLQQGLQELREEAVEQGEETRAGFEAGAQRGEEMSAELAHLLDDAEELESALQAKLQAMETELREGLAEAEELLRSALATELGVLESEAERAMTDVQAFLSGECLPAVAEKSQALFDQLVQTEERLRVAFEGAAEATEAATDDALRTCNQGYEETLAELTQRAGTLQELLEKLEKSVRAGADELSDRKQRWDDGIEATARGLREARACVREVEEMFSRLSFVHT